VARGPVVIVACTQSAVNVAQLDGSPVHAVSCAGNLHTSVIEYLVRAGAAGVLVVSCPLRDCWNREGPKWLLERIYDGREAELKERVDRSRVRVIYAGPQESAELATELRSFRASVARLRAEAEEAIEIDTECERPQPGVGA
jgi:coenzyme F420-reducing hydrogenase delta subunit